MGRRVEYPFGNAYTGIEGGNERWREWMHCIGATNAGTEVVAMFDKHHVVDTLSRQEAELTGIEMDHMDDVSSVICSYGRSHWRETWRLESPWYPFVCQIDGAVFTLNRNNGRRSVNIEPVPGCGPHVIMFDGDKGQVAGLLPRPCFIFDDQEENVALVQEKGYWSGGVVFARDGIPVGRRRRRGHRARSQATFRISDDPLQWPTLVQEFVDLQKSYRYPSATELDRSGTSS